MRTERRITTHPHAGNPDGKSKAALVSSTKATGREGILLGKAISPRPNDSTEFERLRWFLDRTHPLVEQVVRQVACFIASGALRPHARLPSVEAAARHIGIGQRKTAAVYQALLQHGMSNNLVGNGTYLTPHADRAARKYLLGDRAVDFIRYGHTLNLLKEEIFTVFFASYARLERNEEERETETSPHE